jgi:hypothetical protein
LALIDDAETKICDALSIDIIKLDTNINSVGNYIYFDSLDIEKVNSYKLFFNLLLVGKSLRDDKSGLYGLIDKVLNNIKRAKMSGLDISTNKMKVSKDDKLFMYEIQINIKLEGI